MTAIKKNKKRSPSAAKVKSPTERRCTNRFTVYDPAFAHILNLREGLMAKIAHAIDERGWKQAEAAKFFRVTQSRISDLRRARTSQFSLDMLILWLYALDDDVRVLVRGEDANPFSRTAQGSSAESRLKYFNEALALDPTNISALFNRAQVYDSMHSYGLAIADYIRCTELEPDRPGPRFNLASLRLRAGKIEECINDCHILIRDNPDYSWGWELRAEAYEKLGQFDKALQDFNQAIAVAPVMVSGYLARGRMLERLERYEEAMSDYHQACKVQPEDQRTREALDSLKARLAADPTS